MTQRKEHRFMTPRDKFEARQLRETGMTIENLQTWFHVSKPTIMRALAEMREKFGPEQLPRNRRQLARWQLNTNLRPANTQPIEAENHGK